MITKKITKETKDKVKQYANDAGMIVPYAMTFGVIALGVYVLAKVIGAKKS